MHIRRRRPSVLGCVLSALSAIGLALSVGCDDNKTPTIAADDAGAWRSFRFQDFSAARVAFSGGTRPLDAYGLAMLESIGTGKDFEASRAKLRKLIGDAPTDPLAAWAALGLVRLDHVPPRSDAAIDPEKLKADYFKVIADYPATAAADEAMLFRGSLLAQGKTPADLQRALAEIDAYMQARPGNGYMSAMHSLRASIFQGLKMPREQLDAAIAAVKTKQLDPTNPMFNNAWDYFSIGVLAQFDAGDFATARTYYQKMIDEYPNEQRVFLARQLMHEMDELEARLRSKQAGGAR